LYGTRAAIILTALAIALSAFSLTFPFYGMAWNEIVEYPTGTYTFHERLEFYLDYLVIEDRTTFVYDDSPVGDLMDNMKALVLVWLVVGMIYIASCVLGSRAMVRGFVLLACALIPVVYFTAKMPSTIGGWDYVSYQFFTPEGFWGSVSSHPADGSSRGWGPLSGWFLLTSACVIQSVVIIRRNAPMVAAITSQKGAPKATFREDCDSETE
jgi:hypothetical protein